MGGSHKFTDKLTVRLGSWYYTHAAPNSSYIPAIPDGNRLAYSGGFGYKITDHIVFDAAYLQSWFLRRNINNSVTEGLGASQDGDYTTWAQEFIFSLTYKWDNIFKDLGLSHSEAQEATLSSVQSSPSATA